MKILFCGSPNSAIPILEKIIQSKHELVGVVTQSEKPKGRENRLTKTDVAIYCIENNVTIFETANIEKLFESKLGNINFDLAVVVAFGQLIPSYILEKPKYGWINLHYSLLPNLRGAAPVQWSILKNQAETGITWFQIDKGLDTGQILKQKSMNISNLNHDEIIDRLNELAVNQLDELLNDIENQTIKKMAQVGEVTHAPKLTEKDLLIDWNKNVEEIEAKIRAGNNHFRAWTTINGNKIKILNYGKSSSEKTLPGHIRLSSKTVLVGTNSTALVLDEVIPQGRKRMPAFDWLNGIQDKENLYFE